MIVDKATPLITLESSVVIINYVRLFWNILFMDCQTFIHEPTHNSMQITWFIRLIGLSRSYIIVLQIVFYMSSIIRLHLKNLGTCILSKHSASFEASLNTTFI